MKTIRSRAVGRIHLKSVDRVSRNGADADGVGFGIPQQHDMCRLAECLKGISAQQDRARRRDRYVQLCYPRRARIVKFLPSAIHICEDSTDAQMLQV